MQPLPVPKSKIDLTQIKRDIDFFLWYSEKPEKLLYGSDWPLNNISKYIALMKKVLPKRVWEKVFYSNAKQLFKIKD